MQRKILLIIAFISCIVTTTKAQDGFLWSDCSAESFSEKNDDSKTIVIHDEQEMALLVFGHFEEKEPLDGYQIYLENDLDLNYHYWNTESELRLITNCTFDGRGHTISHICSENEHFNKPINEYCGLFLKTQNVKIKNLKISNSLFRAVHYAGPIVGKMSGGQISNCHVDNTVYVYGTGYTTGGLVGKTDSCAVICGCTSSAIVSGQSFVGGLVGHMNNTNVKDCIYLGYMSSGIWNTSTIVGGKDGNSDLSRVYFTDSSWRNCEDSLCYAYAYNARELGDSLFGNQLRVYHEDSDEYREGIEVFDHGLLYDGTFYCQVSEDFLRDTSNIYTISNSRILNLVTDMTNDGYDFSKKKLLLKSDVFTNRVIGNSPEHPFRGEFNGLAHTVTVDINKDENKMALFGYISNATIKHLKVDGTISGHIHSAGLVGDAQDGTMNNITDCMVSAEISCTGYGKDMAHGGGIVGHSNSAAVIIRGCLFNGKLIAKEDTLTESYGGAIIGWCEKADIVHIYDCAELGQYRGFKHIDLSFSHNGTTPVLNNAYRQNDQMKLGKRTRTISPDESFFYLYHGVGNNYYTTSCITTFKGTDGFTAGAKFYSSKGEELKFTAKALVDKFIVGRVFLDGKLYNDSVVNFTMPDKDVLVSAMVYKPDTLFNGNGSSSRPYIIRDNFEWNLLCAKVDNGDDFSGKHFKLDGDFTIKFMLGDQDHPFSGTFDGNGNKRTLNVNLISEKILTAPFRVVRGATLRNIHVTGKVGSNTMYAAGLVGLTMGQTTINNCRVSASVESYGQGDSSNGGFVANLYEGQLSIRSCLFDGKLLGSAYRWGGFVGWSEDNAQFKLERSLFNPIELKINEKESATFIRGRQDFSKMIIENHNYFKRPIGTQQGESCWDIIPGYLVQKLSVYDWEQENGNGELIPVMGERFVKEVFGSNDLNDKEFETKKKGAVKIHFGGALHNDGMLNTITLPFSISFSNMIFSDGGELYQLKGAEEKDGVVNLIFKQTHSFVAGHPYLLRWTDRHVYFDKDATWFSGITIDNPKPDTVEYAGYKMIATFDSITRKKGYDEGIYIMGGDNKWHPVAKPSVENENKMLVGAFRAYLVKPEGSSAKATRMSFVDDDGTVTAVTEVEFDEAENISTTVSDNRWYDLSGRQIKQRPTLPGIYIHGGKKIVVN